MTKHRQTNEGESEERSVEEALRRSAERIEPDPDFIDRLALRLKQARPLLRPHSRPQQRSTADGDDAKDPSSAPSRSRTRWPWFAWAGAALAVLLVAGIVFRLMSPTLPAGPAPTVLAPTEPVEGTLEPAQPTLPSPTSGAPSSPAPEPTAVETEPSFAADLPPAVVTTVPRDGEEVNLQAGILLRFTQPMERDSVEQALSVSPTVTGTFTWHDDTTVSFGAKALASATRYHVSLGTTARATNGEPLTRDLVFAFTTVGPLTVTHTSPTDGAQGLRGDTPLLISFNYPVVPVNCTGQVTAEPDCPPLPLEFSLPGSIREEATPEGAGMWVNSSVYRYDPDPAWIAGTTYTVTVPSGVSSVDGAALASPVEVVFSTAEPQVRSITPARGISRVPLETGVRVEFNTPMDRGVTEDAVTVAGEGEQAVSVTATWVDDGVTLVLTPTARLALDTVYTVEVDPAAQSLSGRPLDEGESTTFTTTPPIGVLNIRRGGRDGPADRLNYYEGARIEIEGLLDPETLEEHVVVTRNGETVNASLFWSEDQPSIHVNWDKVPRQRDCVRVLPGLADRYGNTIDEEQVACFTVEDMPSTFTPIVQREPITLDADEPARVYFASVNLDEVAITLSELNERDMLSYAVAPTGSVQREWTVSLGGERNTPEVVSIDLADGESLPTGYYGVHWRLPGVSYQGPQRLRVAVVDAHVLLKVSAEEALVWATDLRTAQPLVAAEVRVLSRGGAVLGRGVTDRDGIARISIPEQEERWEVISAVVGEPGRSGFGLARSDWNQDTGPWSFDIPYSYENPPAYRAHLQTDRPIYRPGQEVAFRGIVRTDRDGDYGLPAPGTEVRIELQTPDRSMQDAVTLEISEMGTVDGTFRLPEDAPLGGYWLVMEVVGASDSSTTIRLAVAAYRKPEFEVTVTPERDDVLDGETARMLVTADYYSGGVVSGARVRWTVRAEPAAFSPAAGIVGRWRWGATAQWHPWREGEIVAEGEGLTDADGRLLITLDADLAPLGNDETVSAQRWTLEATVLDETNFAVSQRGAITVHTGRFYLGLSPRSWVVLAGETAAVDVLALDWDAEPVMEQAVEVALARRTWRHVPTTAPYSSGTWSHRDTVVDTTQVTTDHAGRGVAELLPPESGSYVVLAESTDADGNRISSETHLWVSGPQMAAWQLAEGKVEPVADAETYRPGDVAQVLLPTPFEAPFEVLMTLEREGILEVERMTIREANPVIEIPITDAHVPNVVVSFVVIKGVGADPAAVPDVRIGMVNLEVEPVDQLLDVSVAAECDPADQDASGRCTFAPGERVDLAVRTRDADGAPVDAELAVAIVDKAVLALADPNSPTLREAYYAPRPLGVISGDGLLVLHNRVAADLEELQRRAEQIALEQGVGGIGGGGGDGAAFAPDVREEFPDTAFWDGSLRTGVDGEARFTVELPDSLTTWVVDARAVTQATEVGEVQAEFVVTKPLIVRPVTPRFLVVGDRAEVAAVVQNNTETDLDVTVSLETNLDLDSPRRSEVRVPAGGRTRVTWTVEVLASGDETAQLTFSAEGGGYRDAARPSVGRESDHALPIYRYESPDVVSVSGALREAGSRIEVVLVPPEAGADSTLTLRLEPTLAAAMVQGLDYLEQFPHACTEQLVSRFLPNVVTARALRDLGVENQELDGKLARLVPEMLAQLYERQNSDGGWGWWQDRPSDLQVSAYATLGLIQAQRAGFAVDEQRLDRALEYLHRELSNRVRAEPRTLPQALALYVLAEASRIGPEGATEAFFEDRETLDVTERAYLALAVGLADPDDPRVVTLLDSLRADANITASGAHWESVSAEHWITWSRATSVVIDALARLAPDDPLLPQAVRWLMVTRQKDHWETTQETAWAVLALTDYVVATGELDAAYDWGVGLNAEALDEGTISATAQAAIEHTIPVEDLLRIWPNRLEISRGEGPGTLYYTADLALTLPVEELAAESRGMTVQRRYCLVDSLGEADDAEVLDTCEPITSAQPGDLVEVRLTLTVPRQRHYVVLEDAYPAGMEPVDPTLNTAQQEAAPSYTPERSTWWWPSFDREELRDERAVFYARRLSPGTYEVRYYFRAAVPGEYRVLPATVSEMYFPEVWGRTEGMIFAVTP